MDIVTCPGTDTCKLGISSSRGLAAELRKEMAETGAKFDEAVENLHIKISGCFNSCGQHHVADLGFYGVSRKFGGYAVPHFQVVLGGEWEHNAGSYGLPVAAVPSKNIPKVVTRLTERYLAGRTSGETFKDFVKRTGKVELKNMLDDLTKPPAVRPLVLQRLGRSAGIHAWATTAWANAREKWCRRSNSIWPRPSAKCSRRRLLSKTGRSRRRAKRPTARCCTRAKALVKISKPDISDDPDQIVSEFRTRYYDTQKFWDPFAGGKFASYLFDAHQKAGKPYTPDSTRYLIDEAQLFIDAAHSCNNKLSTPVSV